MTQSTPNGKLSTTPQPNLNKVRNIMNAFEESHNLKLKTSLNHPVTQGLEVCGQYLSSGICDNL